MKTCLVTPIFLLRVDHIAKRYGLTSWPQRGKKKWNDELDDLSATKQGFFFTQCAVPENIHIPPQKVFVLQIPLSPQEIPVYFHTLILKI